MGFLNLTKPYKLKLIWDTNLNGITLLGLAWFFQIWLIFCDESSVTQSWMSWSRSQIEALWEWVWVVLFKENHFSIHVIGISVNFCISFVVLNAPFLLVDLTGYPRWFINYKIQDDKYFPVDKKLVIKILKNCTMNMLVVNTLSGVLTFPLGLMLPTGPLPTFGELAVQLTAFRIAEEFVAYYMHRFLHRPGWYYIHKQHHEITAPLSITSIYCSPLEHVVNNILPTVAGPLLLGTHIGVFCLWETMVIFAATIEHAGYHLPFLYSNEGHDFHHKTFTSWFGNLGVLDVIHGTDEPFGEVVEGKRAFITFSLTPVKQLVKEKEL